MFPEDCCQLCGKLVYSLYPTKQTPKHCESLTLYVFVGKIFKSWENSLSDRNITQNKRPEQYRALSFFLTADNSGYFQLFQPLRAHTTQDWEF